MDPITAIQTAQMSVDALKHLLGSVISLGGQVIAISAPLAAILPPPSNGGFLGRLHTGINLLAFNIHQAANSASSPASDTANNAGDQPE